MWKNLKRVAIATAVMFVFALPALAQYDKYAVRFSYPAGPTTITQSSSGYELLSDALQYAIENDRYGIVRLTARSQTDPMELDEGITINRGGVVIELAPQTTLVAAPTPIGVFSWIGATDVGMTGQGKILVESLMPSQTLMKFTSCTRPVLTGVTIDDTTTGGSSSTPVTFAHFDTCLTPEVSWTNSYPAEGVRCFFMEDGMGGFWSNNYIGTSQEGGNGGSGPSYTSRLCWRVLHSLGWEFWRADNNILRGLGSEEDPLDTPFLFANSLDGTDEQGHWVFSGCKLEDVDAPNMCELYGQWFVEIAECDFGATPVPQTNNTASIFDAAILVMEQTDAANYSNHVTIRDNRFHNIQHSAGYTEIADALTTVEIINGNEYHLTSGTWTATPTATQFVHVTYGGALRYHEVVSADTDSIVVAEPLTNAAAGTATTIETVPLTPAPSIFARNSRQLRIQRNHFVLASDGPSVMLQADSITIFNIDHNTFEAFGGQACTQAVRLIRSAAVDTLGLCTFMGNSVEGYYDGCRPPLGFAGPVMWQGANFVDRIGPYTTIAVQSIATSSGDYPRLLADALSVTATTISFVNSGDAATGLPEITRSSGSFAFSKGDWVRVTGTTNNDGVYRIKTAGTGTLTLYPEFKLVTEAAGSSFTVARAMFAGLRPGDLVEVDGPTLAANRGLFRVRDVTADANGVDFDIQLPYFSNFTNQASGATAITVNLHPRTSTNVCDPVQASSF